MNIAERILRKLVVYLNYIIKRQYLKRVSYDICCERCKTWQSEVNGMPVASFITPNMYCTKCAKCGHVSYWSTRSGIVSESIPTITNPENKEEVIKQLKEYLNS